ncbi:protein kinase domain-containing protein [Nonomuraea diastatica]|uniref:non-specific serine/threonine protein kinase n=1 Tax=Nonomuraea diastatica TaxID=1848329 RepID=A0A4V2YFA7_9ACTN|nr:protein kinase [Nonomuraea diastatica]TDD22487.1 serine/threonine protein kinase [Nonomuraea diastatica]
MIGKRVAGRFVIEAQLGSGGMGWVWRGRDNKLDRVVALKQVRADVGRLPELKARAEREAQALARIDHPGIVRVHDVLDAPDGPWIVMDYVQGTVLGALITRAPLSEPAVVRIGAQALDALAAAHAVGVLHRDVKPDNILITASSSVVLVDFGIATIEGHERITMLGHVVGTPDFIAPERIRGTPVGPAADLWSLGATLYTALEGRPPFHKSTEEATRFAILTSPPDPMTRAVRLKPMLNRLLAKSPANRMTAGELARQLEGAARGDPGAGPRRPSRASTTTPPRSSRPARKEDAARANGGVPGSQGVSDGRGVSGGDGGGGGAGAGVAAGRVRRTLADVGDAERGSMILTLPPDEAAVLLAERWKLFTTAAVEEMCRQAAKSATILQMLLPSRAGWLLNQVRDPGLVARVVLAMGAHHRGLVLGQMHDRHSAAAIEAMAAADTRQTGLAVAAMQKDPAAQALSRLPPATIAGLLAQVPPSCRGSLVPLLPSGLREEVARRLAG